MDTKGTSSLYPGDMPPNLAMQDVNPGLSLNTHHLRPIYCQQATAWKRSCLLCELCSQAESYLAAVLQPAVALGANQFLLLLLQQSRGLLHLLPFQSLCAT